MDTVVIQTRTASVELVPRAGVVTSRNNEGVPPGTLLQAERQIIDLMASGAGLKETLTAIALMVEQLTPPALCTVLLLDADGKHLRGGAAPSLPETYSKAIDGVEIGPSVGSCGTAAYRKEPVVVRDIASDPLWEGPREFALSFGLRACWSMPVIDEAGTVLGTIAMYYRASREPTERDFGLLAPGARLVRLALVQHRKEEELRAGELRLRVAVEATGLGTFDIDLTTKEVVWSDRMKEILGFAQTAKPDYGAFLNLVHPDDAARITAGYKGWIGNASRQQAKNEIRVLRANDGAERIVSLSGRILKNAQGTPTRAIGTCADVTEIRKTERHAKEAADRFRQLFEAASDWFWEKDERGYLIFVSPNFEVLYGPKVSEVVGKRLHEIPGVTIAPEMAQNALSAIDARRPFRDYIYAYQPPGSERKRWIHTNGIPMVDEHGKFQGYRGVCRDITEQVDAEEALRRSEQKFRQLFEIGSDYYWETDAQYRVSYLSPNYEAVVGAPADEALGRRLSDNPDVRIDPRMGKVALAAQKAKKPFRDFVYSRKTFGGEIRWFSMSAAPMFGEDGAFHGYRGVAADVTARINAEGAAALMFSSAPVPMLLLDVKAQRYTEINDSALGLLGYSREQALAMPAEAFFAPDERDRYQKLREIPAPSSGRRGVWRYLSADGSELRIDVTVHPIRAQGRSMAIVALVDVTERIRIESEMRLARDAAVEASCAKSDLLANMKS